MKYEFSLDDDNETLTLLRIKTKRKNREQVIRDALSLYQFLIKQIEEDQKIYIGKERKDANELICNQLENARK